MPEALVLRFHLHHINTSFAIGIGVVVEMLGVLYENRVEKGQAATGHLHHSVAHVEPHVLSHPCPLLLEVFLLQTQKQVGPE